MGRPTPGTRTVAALLGAVTAAAVVAACATPSPSPLPPPPLPSGPMDVLGPVPAFEASAVPADWIIEGTVGREGMAVVERDGVPALRVVNGPTSFVAAKPTRASLLATPYLSWAWNVEPSPDETHPVRLVIGYVGGASKGRPETRLEPERSTVLPVHDRAMVITWNESALKRGSITLPPATGGRQPAARYVGRGGRENTSSWWLETVDLSDLYRRAWPADDIANVRITFIGVAAAGGGAPGTAFVSGIRLSR